MTVYVICRPGYRRDGVIYDVSPASKYGEIRYIFEGKLSTITDDPFSALQQAISALEDFDPDVDYVAWAGGNPLAMLLVGDVLGEMCDSYNYLSFVRNVENNYSGEYVPVRVMVR